MRVLSRSLVLATTAIALIGCRDDDRQRAVEIPSAPGNLPANALSAFVTVSNPDADVGDEVLVTVRALRGSAVGAIGSFTLRLAYDSLRVRFLEAGTSSHGMVLTNTKAAGVVVAAGASSSGFVDDQLVTARFRVTGPRGLRSLELAVSELNSVSFEDQRSAMRVERSLYRDRTPR